MDKRAPFQYFWSELYFVATENSQAMAYQVIEKVLISYHQLQ